MPIPRTAIHDELPGPAKLLERQRIVRNVQNDMARNAERHKEMLALGAPLEKVQAFVRDCAANYAYWLDQAEAIAADPDVQAEMALRGWTEKDFVDVVDALRPEVAALRDAPKVSRRDIETACDAVIAVVDRPVIAVPTVFDAAVARAR